MNFRLKLHISNLSIRGFRQLWLALLFVGLPAYSAQQTNTFARPDYSAFRIVVERNIFNSKRSRDYVDTGRVDRPRASTKNESFALVGTMNQGAGPIAFFEGSRSDYRKVLKHEETIAGFKVADIQPSFVKLASSTNEIELRLGMQLVREEEGPWHLTVRPESLESPVSTSSSRSYSRSSSNGRSNDSSQARNSDNPPSSPDAIGSFNFPNGFFPGAAPPLADQQSPPAVNNQPGSNGNASGNGEDILAILRRKREAENQ